MVAQPAERPDMAVADPGTSQGAGQGLRVELGIAARARHASDIDQEFGPRSAQQGEEILDRMNRMADGQHPPRGSAGRHRARNGPPAPNVKPDACRSLTI